MPSLLIDELEPNLLTRLRNRAAASGRTVEEEAKSVLETALRGSSPSVLEAITAFRERLAASGRTFSDSAELVREDRDR